MKRLIADVYKIIYHLTHAKSFALVFSIAYVAILNVVALYGLIFLLSPWFPLRPLLRLFHFPVVIVTTMVMCLLNAWMMKPLNNMYKERKKEPYYPSIIAYTALAIIVMLYMHYKDILFQ